MLNKTGRIGTRRAPTRSCFTETTWPIRKGACSPRASARQPLRVGFDGTVSTSNGRGGKSGADGWQGMPPGAVKLVMETAAG